MKHHYPSIFTFLLVSFFMVAAQKSQAQNQIVVSGAGEAAVNGTYTYSGDIMGMPAYTNGIYRIEYYWEMYFDPMFGFPMTYSQWRLINTTDPSYTMTRYYSYDDGYATPIKTWYRNYSVDPAPAVSNLVAFTSGAAFIAPGANPNTTNNPIGRFQLDPGAWGSHLTNTTVMLSGNISAMTNVKLWWSNVNTFSTGTASVLSSKTAASSVTFDGFNLELPLSGAWFFVTTDLNNSALGNVSANIAGTSAFSISSGSISGSISNASLSSGPVMLPLQLLSFIAETQEQAITLNWTTTREENVKGFDIEQSTDGVKWTKLAFVAGTAGNNLSTVNQYAFNDEHPIAGHSFYRLKMLDQSGSFTYSKVLTIKTGNITKSVQCYPNPFTQSANIAFQLPAKSFTTLKVYNAMGVEVSTLMNKQLNAGNYTVAFDGTSLSAGLYMYTLKYGSQVVSGTILKK